ncbi:transcriptional repressor [Podochytrium sp. JEL0797]|nr:transcriptional repressor [Podochytrium sp. JEL0797]
MSSSSNVNFKSFFMETPPAAHASVDDSSPLSTEAILQYLIDSSSANNSTNCPIDTRVSASLDTSPLSQKESEAMKASLFPSEHLFGNAMFQTPLPSNCCNDPDTTTESYHSVSPETDTEDTVVVSDSETRRKKPRLHSNPSNRVVLPTPLRVQEPDVPKTRNYRCLVDGCGLDFLSKGHLIRHVRIHNGERPFKCSLPDCELTFPRSDTAIKHSRNHVQKLQLAGHVIPAEYFSPKVTLANPDSLPGPMPAGITTRPYRKRKTQRQVNDEVKELASKLPNSASATASSLPTKGPQPANNITTTLTFPTPYRYQMSPLLITSESTSPHEHKMSDLNLGMSYYPQSVDHWFHYNPEHLSSPMDSYFPTAFLGYGQNAMNMLQFANYAGAKRSSSGCWLDK